MTKSTHRNDIKRLAVVGMMVFLGLLAALDTFASPDRFDLFSRNSVVQSNMSRPFLFVPVNPAHSGLPVQLFPMRGISRDAVLFKHSAFICPIVLPPVSIPTAFAIRRESVGACLVFREISNRFNGLAFKTLLCYDVVSHSCSPETSLVRATFGVRPACGSFIIQAMG